MNSVWEVWTIGAILIALIGGGLTGLVLGTTVPSNPAYRGSRAQMVAGFSIIGFIGIVFYIGQTIEAWASGDPLWWRVVARGGIWILFSASLAVAGAYAQSRREPGITELTESADQLRAQIIAHHILDTAAKTAAELVEKTATKTAASLERSQGSAARTASATERIADSVERASNHSD